MKGSFEMNKIISVLLCVVMITTAVICAVPSATAYNQKTPLENASDFSWDNASVYFLLTDRFQNGNTSNDHSYGRALDASGQPISGWNTSPGTFHGGDFAGITQKINEGYFNDLGVNAIWISAPYEQIHGYVTPGGSNDFAHYSYHGYYVLDYTETDANFGTKEEFRTMVDTAHKNGIRVIMDVVMNHAGYNTLKDMFQYNFGTFKDRDAAQSYLYKITGVNDLHSTVNYDGTAADWGRWWGADWVRSGLPGYAEGSGSDEMQCLAGLPDFKTEQTQSVSIPPILQTKWNAEGTYSQKVSKYGSSDTVSNYIVKWLSEWVSQYGVDGFRCDTAKHVEKSSWKKLKESCSAALKQWRTNHPSSYGAEWTDDFWMTGEHWDHKLGYDSYYTEGGFDSMINFDFSGSGVPAAGSINGVYQRYADTINNQAGFNALTYISSHDSNLARGDLIYQGSAFQLLPGAIQIFYGDETNRPTVAGMGFDGHGGSGHSLRSDMNWTTADQSILKHWQKVGKFRSNHVAVGAGDHQQISAYSADTGYTFSRSYDNGEMSDGIIAVISAPANKTIDVSVSSMWGNGVTLTNAYDGTTAVVQGGKARFNSGPNGTILIEGPQSSIRMSLKGAYSFYNSETVTVSLRGADYAMASVNGGAEFRVVDGQTFTIGENVGVGEIFEVTLKASNAEDTLEKSYSFKKKDPDAVISVYFDNTDFRWTTVNAYIYDESTGEVLKNGAWPGKPMTYDSSLGYYVYEVEDELTNGRVIFNGGGDANKYPTGANAPGLEIGETNMVLMAGNQWVPYTGQVPQKPTEPDPSETTTVFFDNTSSKFAIPCVYCWRDSDKKELAAWPGTPMTKYKDNIYTASFPKIYDRCIFSDNKANKTGDLTIPGTNQIFNGTSWSAYTVATQPTNPSAPTGASETVTYLYGDADCNGTVNINDVTWIQMALARYFTNGEFTELGQILADVDGVKGVSIGDANAIQCSLANIVSQKGKTGEIYTQTVTPSNPENPTTPSSPTQPSSSDSTDPTVAPAKNTVYYKNVNNWNPVHAYFWSDTNEHMMEWPGIPMTLVSGNIFSIEVPEGATMVIFTQGDWRTQTANIQLAGPNKIYEDNTWKDYTG